MGLHYYAHDERYQISCVGRKWLKNGLDFHSQPKKRGELLPSTVKGDIKRVKRQECYIVVNQILAVQLNRQIRVIVTVDHDPFAFSSTGPVTGN